MKPFLIPTSSPHQIWQTPRIFTYDLGGGLCEQVNPMDPEVCSINSRAWRNCEISLLFKVLEFISPVQQNENSQDQIPCQNFLISAFTPHLHFEILKSNIIPL